jgi:glycosyltransferase involved in cell wall biosynthesis
MPEVTLTIAGSSPSPEVLDLASARVDVTGWIENLGPELDRARVMAAPLRYGAGIKGKVTQSLAAGLPVVTTRIGAEGLDVSDGREMLIRDDPKGFASALVRLYRDDGLWRELSAAGQRLAERSCSPAKLKQELEELLGA